MSEMYLYIFLTPHMKALFVNTKFGPISSKLSFAPPQRDSSHIVAENLACHIHHTTMPKQ